MVGAILIAIDGSTIRPILESIQESIGVNESIITGFSTLKYYF